MRGYTPSAIIPVPLATPLPLGAARARSAHTAKRERPSGSREITDSMSAQAARANAKKARAKAAKAEAAAERARRAAEPSPVAIMRREIGRRVYINGALAHVPEPAIGWAKTAQRAVDALGSRDALRRELGVTKKTVSLWVRGRAHPTGDRARRLIELGAGR